MIPRIAALALTTALTIPAMAQARPVTLAARLTNYGGDGAYLAFYLTDAKGNYVKTIYMAGGRPRYYRHLGDWMRLSNGDYRGLSGITGASIGSGGLLQVTVDVADSLIDAGYTLHIDAAAQNFREMPSEITMPFTSANANQVQTSRGYIHAFAYNM
ncbi:MAG: DUF2271 domain-containing protein [Limimaricola sp.]|uniref:DUF2271 domain-containing protein n=1 Tax=Limimaricola sp. TaxID=2211665 RepID=UPI001D6F79E1|nr:DUF2271 domain-containing protein [Limimaricola sp.]MBI1418275.1 DUF2271 domain-containing protein [Limimaricola sp.]